MDIGLGWHINKTYSPPIIWHNGGTGGYRSFIGFDDVRRRGVVVLSNTANSVDDIGLHLLDPRFPSDSPAPRAAMALAPDVAEQYVGRYALTPGFVITFSREGRNFVQATGQNKLEAFAESDSKFFLKTVDAQVSFIRDAQGKFNVLMLHQNGTDQTARRLIDPARDDPRPRDRGPLRRPLRAHPRFRDHVQPGRRPLFVQATDQPRLEAFAASETDFS